MRDFSVPLAASVNLLHCFDGQDTGLHVTVQPPNVPVEDVKEMLQSALDYINEQIAANEQAQQKNDPVEQPEPEPAPVETFAAPPTEVSGDAA